MKSPIAPPRITKILPTNELTRSTSPLGPRSLYERPKYRQPQPGHEQPKRQPRTTANLDALLGRRAPSQKIAEAPWGNREPDACNHQDIRPGLNHQHPMRLLQRRAARI